MIGTCHFRVQDLGARVVEHHYWGVSGFSTIVGGRLLYEIEQYGYAQVARDTAGGRNSIEELHWEHRPNVKDRKELITVDTMDGRIFLNCQLISTETSPSDSGLIRAYRWVFRQVSPGINHYTI